MFERQQYLTAEVEGQNIGIASDVKFDHDLRILQISYQNIYEPSRMIGLDGVYRLVF